MGKLTSLAGYQHEQNKIKHASSLQQTWYRYNRNRDFVSEAIDWGTGVAGSNSQTAIIGGYGEYGTEKNTTTLKQDAELNAFSTSGITHQIDAGWQVDSYQAEYRRFGDAYVSRGVATISPKTQCQSDDAWCIGGEQYIGVQARRVSGIA